MGLKLYGKSHKHTQPCTVQTETIYVILMNLQIFLYNTQGLSENQNLKQMCKWQEINHSSTLVTVNRLPPKKEKDPCTFYKIGLRLIL